MSYKGTDVENKAVAPVPRELSTLREVTQQLREATGLKAKERAAALVEEVERAWKRANTLQLQLSAQGGHADLLVDLADSLNAAQAARGRALTLISPMTAQYS